MMMMPGGSVTANDIDWGDPIVLELMKGSPLPPGQTHRFRTGDPRSHALQKKGANAQKGRKRLSNHFLNDLANLWQEQGEACLRRAIMQDPMSFAMMVAKLMPQKIEVSDTTLEDVGDDQLDSFIDAIQRRLERRADRAKLVGGGGAGAPLTIDARAVAPGGVQPPALL